MRRRLGAALLILAGCSSDPVASRGAGASAPAPESSPRAGPERHFGAPLQSSAAPIEVSEVLHNPRPFLDKTIKCAGTVARVCQAAGCWLELRPAGSAEGEGLRVPMAGHSFFVPQDVVGRPAIVEGTLGARDLPQAELDHLQGEGLKAIGPLYLAATSVVVR